MGEVVLYVDVDLASINTVFIATCRRVDIGMIPLNRFSGAS
jgi:hypothetical protein